MPHNFCGQIHAKSAATTPEAFVDPDEHISVAENSVTPLMSNLLLFPLQQTLLQTPEKNNATQIIQKTRSKP